MTKITRLMMGMPISIDLPDLEETDLIDEVFSEFANVDARFSPYRDDSELSRLNAGALHAEEISAQMREVLEIARDISAATGGYFDPLRPDGNLDPSGVVKGWAILRAARQIAAAGQRNFCVDAGGDIQCAGTDAHGAAWRIGIQSPFNPDHVVKVVTPKGGGMATSGNYVRGDHIYNPHQPSEPVTEIVSLTVIAPDVLTADLHATAGFAMGARGIYHIEATAGLEGYAIAPDGTALATTGFKEFVA
ncbi:MAG: FAD:protein FMN transferase [Rhodobacteraceae bacterium]|nr:FAD:protein FMN transferase [Paracoccaceae bacterium]